MPFTQPAKTQILKKLIFTPLLFAAALVAFAAADSFAVNVAAYSDLDAAISGQSANITFTSSTITFASILPTVNYTPVDFYNAVTLNGQGFYPIFYFSNTTATFHNNITFTNAYSISYGAAISNVSATVNFSGINVVFSSNSIAQAATGYGGALYNSSSTMTFTGSTVTFNRNSITPGNAGYGGAVYNKTSVMNFINCNAEFSSNTVIAPVGGYGGAIYNDSSAMTFTGGAVTFSGNRASSVGGVIYNNSSSMTFTSSTVMFSGNTSGPYAGAVCNITSTMTFTNSAVMFSLNTSSTIGGAIENVSSNIAFTSSTVAFNGNTVTYGSGGAVYNTKGTGNSVMNFNSSSVSFTANTAAVSGGAIFNDNSSLNFNMSSRNNVIFSSNAASNGGGVYNNSATVTFTGGNAAFNLNMATSGSGGAINNSGGLMSFNSSSLNFTGNKASGSGGAICSGGAVNFNLSSGNNVIFSSNTASSGGAIYNYSSTMTFAGGSVVFNQNSAGTYGGAVYNNAAGSAVNFNSPSTNFTGNSAIYGGAIGAGGGSNINFSGGSVTFTGNSATTGGGAIYIISASAVTFNTDAGQVVFNGNTAGGKPNDVYMDANSKLNISGANAIGFEGGILTNTSAGTMAVNKSGTGTMYLGGTNAIWGDFNITGGDIVLLADASYSGKALNLGNASALDMHNGTANSVTVNGNFSSKKNLSMDIFADGKFDQITAGTANISGSLGVFAGVGVYSNKEFDLIVTSGTGNLSGEFTSSSILSANNGSLNYELKYEDGMLKLIVNGMSVTHFEDISPLSYNQSRTAQAFRKISLENPGNWVSVLNDMMIKQNNGDIAAVKEFLAETSGYFLANAVRNLAADSLNNEVYDKIRCRDAGMQGCGVTDNSSGLWIQLKGGRESFKSDENSPQDYSGASIGAMFGFDRFLAEKPAGADAMWGVYAKASKGSAEQGKNKADGNKYGFGAYGGYIRDSWELKAALLGGYGMFSTERAVMGETAKADINAFTVSADLEAAIKIEMAESMKLKPYAGLEFANTMYGDFKESGADIYDLDVKAGNYTRSAARAGAQLNYEKKIWMFYANVEGKYMISGTLPEIVSRFDGTEAEFNSRGAEEGKTVFGAGLGGEVTVAGNWKIFINGKYYTAERYENLSGNAGVRYLFGKKKNAAARNYEKEARYAEMMADEAAESSKEAAEKVNEAKKQTGAKKIKAANEGAQKADEAVKKAEAASKRAKEAMAARASGVSGTDTEKDFVDLILDRAFGKADDAKRAALKSKEETQEIIKSASERL